MPSKVHFVLNSHGLGFDRYSLLCIKSLRRACGDAVRLSVFCPTNLPPPSPTAIRFYERYNVEIVSFRNDFLPDSVTDIKSVKARHLTFNKLYTLNDVQNDERRIFIDADIVFLSDPTEHFKSIEEPTACVAVDTPESFPGDWEELYRQLNVAFPRETIEVWETYVYRDAAEPPKVRIPPFLCSNVIFVGASSKLPGFWLEVCREIENRIELLPRSFFVDQVGLSVAVQKANQPWHLLPKAYNTAFETWRFVESPCLFHYVTFDALAAATARFPEVGRVMTEVVEALARDDGLDLRFQLLTQWPRWYRRALALASNLSERSLGVPLISVRDRD